MKIRFVSPWYPDYALVHSGVFVAKQVEAVRAAGHEVVVDVPQIFPAPPGPLPDVVIGSMRSLARRSVGAMFARTGEVTYVPTPVPTRGGAMGRARAMARSLSLLAEVRRPGDHDVVHAHLGMPTAWAVSEADPERPMVVTEHQSTLATVLAEPDAASAYAAVVRKADVFVCVSEHLRDQIADGVGDWAHDLIEVVPNIVDLTHIPFRSRLDPAFSSWVYIGGLMAHKGVQDLLRVFDAYVKTYDGNASLTLVGEGPLRQWVEAFAASRGMSAAVRLAGSVEHHRLGPYLDSADLMVHLSPAETFGIAPLEGIGAGLPVIALRNWGTVNTWADIEEFTGAILPLDSKPEEIAEAIAALRDSSSRLDGLRGRRMIADRYSARIVADRLVDIYQRAMR